MPPERSCHLAIDFGTSNTTAAYRIGDQPPAVLRLTPVGNLLPSAVFIEDDGTFSTGQRAINSAAFDVTRFEATPKRQLDFGEVLMGGRQRPVTDLVAAVLRNVLATARERVGGGFDTVVLTHPQAWDDILKNRLTEAGLKAGIDEHQLALVAEPEAAARFYSHFYPSELPANGKACVFDLGAGTLDIAVLEKRGDDFALLKAAGDPALGGLTFDAHIRAWLLREVQDSPDLVAAASKRSTRPDLMDSIRRAKEDLTDSPRTKIPIPGMAETARGWVQLRREEFQGLIANDVSRAVELTKQTLEQAGAAHAGSVLLYLTGGASSVPLVQERLNQAKMARIERLEDPKTVVAAGALLVPGVLKTRNGRLPPKPPPPRTGHVIYAPTLPTTGSVRRVFKRQGDAVKPNDALLDLVAGRALYAIYAPVGGRFVHQTVNVGSLVSTNTDLGVIGDTDLSPSDRTTLPWMYAWARELPPDYVPLPPHAQPPRSPAPPPTPAAAPPPSRATPTPPPPPAPLLAPATPAPAPPPTAPLFTPAASSPPPAAEPPAVTQEALIHPRVNGKATLALVSSLLLGLCWGVGGVAAIVLALMAKSEIRASGGTQQGENRANAALIIGIVGVVAWIVVGVIVALNPSPS